MKLVLLAVLPHHWQIPTPEGEPASPWDKDALTVVFLPRPNPPSIRSYSVRKKSRRREIEAALGDLVLFCTRNRLGRVGGAYGLQPVQHGVKEIPAGTRVVLGVPFHEYR